MAKAFHVCERVHLTKKQIAADISSKRIRVADECARMVQDLFAGTRVNAHCARFTINGKHYT